MVARRSIAPDVFRVDTTVTLLGFGAFFLQNKPQDHTLSGEFVYGVLPGTSGPGNSTGSVAFSLRLIH